MMPWTEQLETLAVFVPGQPAQLQVLHHDERLIAVIKGPHEPTTPQGEHQHSLLERVRAQPSWADAIPIHSLDIGTSGVCLFAKHREHAAVLSRALAEGSKEYVAVARGIVRPKGAVNRPMIARGRQFSARSRYKRIEVVAGHSMLSVRPEGGRKRQIRFHLASIGHPILGDARYGDRASNQYFEFRHGLDRPFLHCARVVLAFDGKELDLRSPLAPDLAAVLESMQSTQPDDD
jgi:23S rRNA (uracil1939-C5)-methyltransferase